MTSVEVIRGRETRVDQFDGNASAVLDRAEAALDLIGIERVYATKDIAKSDTGLVVGDYIRVLGYYSAFDGGVGADYKIVTVATHGETPDGYGDHLTATGLVMQLQHQGMKVIDAHYGVVRGSECSARWQAAFWAAADMASESRSDNLTATFMGVTDFNAKNKIFATARDGSTVELLEIVQTGAITAVVGGNLEPSTFAAPIPLMTVKASSCRATWGQIDCDRICSGWLGVAVSDQKCNGLSVIHFDCYGAFIPKGSNGAFKMENYNIKQWLGDDPEWTDDAAYTGYGLVVGNKDMQFGKGEVGWCGVPLCLLDATPSDPLDEVEGRNVFRGYDSEGSGGCTFLGVHPMAGRPGGPPRLDNLANGGPTIIEVWNNTNVAQINFADLDAGIIRIYGKGVEINRPNYIVGGANDPINDRAVVLDPLIRIYANGTNNPSKISINSEQGVTVGFFDFEGNSWDGNYDAWNVTGRQSIGLWTGDVDVQATPWDPTTGAFPAASTAGDYWVVEKAGTVDGQAFIAGDGLISLVNGASTSTYAANWEHNTVADIAQRDESLGMRVEQGANVILSRNDSNDWMNIWAPGAVGQVRIKMRVAAGNPLIIAADETGTGRIDANAIRLKNWEADSGGDWSPVNDGTQKIGTALRRVQKIFANALDISLSAFGYVSGAGGVVTQATSKATGVTLNKPSGVITTNAAALAAGTAVSFTVTNSAMSKDDAVIVTVQSPSDKYRADVVNTANGSFIIELTNKTGGSLSEAVLLNFAVIKVAVA